MTNLTPKQKKTLEIIYKYTQDTGLQPSLANLREELKVTSNQSVLNFLKALEQGGYIKKQGGEARSISILPLGFKVLNKQLLVPLVGQSSAGAFVESYADAFSEWIPLPSKLLENEAVKQAKEDVFVIKVHGDSMVNANIFDNNVLLIQKTNQFRSGDIVVVRSDDGTTVKRFVAESDGRAYLKPENPAYKIIPIFEDMVFEGKVIANLSLINK